MCNPPSTVSPAPASSQGKHLRYGDTPAVTSHREKSGGGGGCSSAERRGGASPMSPTNWTERERVYACPVHFTVSLDVVIKHSRSAERRGLSCDDLAQLCTAQHNKQDQTLCVEPGHLGYRMQDARQAQGHNTYFTVSHDQMMRSRWLPNRTAPVPVGPGGSRPSLARPPPALRLVSRRAATRKTTPGFPFLVCDFLRKKKRNGRGTRGGSGKGGGVMFPLSQCSALPA